MSTATRSQLKVYFGSNCIPTASNFSDLIDSMLNQTDDGIVKSSGYPLAISAETDTTTPQQVLNLFVTMVDANPAWTLQLNPRSNQNDSSTGNPGFSISDATGISQLFIEQSSNNIGLGTIKPQVKLDINGSAKVGGTLTVTGAASFSNNLSVTGAASFQNALTVTGSATFNNTLSVTGSTVTIGQGNNNTTRMLGFAHDTGDEGSAGSIIYKPGYASNTLSIVGAGNSGDSRIIRLYDNVDVVSNLTVNNGQQVYPKIKVYKDNTQMNGGMKTEGQWTISYSGDFTEVYTAFVIFQGYSIWGIFDPTYYISGTGNIPQLSYVKLTSFNNQSASGVSFCSESDPSAGADNTVMFTLVVIGV